MRDASAEPVRQTLQCQCCQRTIVVAVEGLFANPRSGSPQRFCNAACRQAAYRRRKADVAETTTAQRSGGRDRRLRPPEEVTPTAQ